MRKVFESLARIRPIKLAIYWTVTIIVLLSIPGEDIPSTGLEGWDKPVHATLFFVFTILWFRAISLRFVYCLLLTLLISTAFSVITELYQGMLPFGRIADPLDVVANWIGTGLASLYILYQYFAGVKGSSHEI